MADTLRIAVVYALPDRQTIVNLQMPRGATLGEAVGQSGLLNRHPELARPLACAIFGKVAPLTAPLRDGDRIEILRPLLIDPKEQRRQAAAAGLSTRATLSPSSKNTTK